ncbi:bifunctional phosphopantothenoylcysteine decarboxylase/phosphopantothenate--cysteine ligase CoaBC [Salinibacterium sp. ZJ70]|uniref:bifunctional phosphopantothenoylcysteine decarboxylase/phosphopantothenate--cysteine ligase CoaBC n=1 Tax=Salinibacterium sp. ZJ70 TaxID=2708084 RepID=UPI001CD1ADAD|nr:bifunctional phosphopantothenoylcysteine decarboxylase/phosphopantothenate--cysteine ligase CoaBC [Salinibacterium sp. ZJ70]
MGDALRIVVGIAGGIAAYKAVGVVREFVRRGHDVHVVATRSALEFVGRPTLEAISRNPVQTELFEGVAEVRHVALGQSADLIVVAPATANTLAKITAGLSDDLLGTTILASEAPLVVAPAMHTEMWQNPATQHNIETLRSRGVHIVGPASGQLTGTDSGVGRMAEPVEIAQAALALVGPRDLVGRRIVVSAGGTREPLDPVRFLGNRSSGKQGVALAQAAAARGADVVLVAAHLEVPAPLGVTLRQVETAAQLRDAMRDEAASADIVIMAAAVADYRPETVADAKIKKETQGDELVLRLVKNPDILAELAAARPREQLVIGFAAETEPDDDTLIALGRAKIARKGCDLLVLNRVGWSEGFATESNSIVILSQAGDIVTESRGTKLEVAHAILDVVR